MNLLEDIQELDRTRRWNPTFQMLHIDTRQLIENKTQKASRLPENRSLNRYRDVLPYDDTRVKLKTSDNDYINANYVEVPEVKRRYILAQGPLPHTCEAFWRMVWENNTTAVIMLNRVVEKNMIKCHPYWPMGEDEISEFGDFQIINQSTQMENSYIIREFVVTNHALKESRKIKQFHYITWPDFGVPEDPQSFLQYLENIKRNDVFSNPETPPVVHCSAGIGRSGTFCLVDSALTIAEEDGALDNVDIRSLLLNMRKCRCGLVQTAEQFRFANVAILHGLYALYPESFKEDSITSHAFKTNDDEPPPLPPRRINRNSSVPPPKPERNVQTEEDQQRKRYQDITALISEESGSSEDEIINLSDDSTELDADDISIGIKDDIIDGTDETVDNEGEISSATVDHDAEDDNEKIDEDVTQTNQTTKLLEDKIEKDIKYEAKIGSERNNSEILIGSKASENKELRHRLREKKNQELKERVENIKQKMHESERKSSSWMIYLLYGGVAMSIFSGICYAGYKWWS